MCVKRLSLLAIWTLLLLSARNLLAQHGGHGSGGGRRGTPGAGSGDTSDAGLTDFNHALAVQATSDQISHFRVDQEHGDREEAGAGPLGGEREGRQRR